MTDRVPILDFGSRDTQSIARRIQESGVYADILPVNAGVQVLKSYLSLKLNEWREYTDHSTDWECRTTLDI